MTEFQVKQSTFARGFESRLQQLIVKKATQQEMEKQALMGKALGAGARGLGRVLGGLERMPTLGEMVGRGVGAFRRGAGRMGEHLGQEFNVGKGGLGSEYARGIGGVRPPVMRPPPALGSEYEAAAGAAPTPPLRMAAPGGGAAGAGGGGGGAFGSEYAQGFGGGMDPNAARGFLSGLPNRMPGWMQNNPALVAGAGGIGATKGYDEFKDYRRRQALRNLPWYQRLGLGAEMLFSPESAINQMRL